MGSRELTGDEIVEAVLSTKRDLADEGKPGQQPSRKLLGEDSPVEFLLFATAQAYARFVGQTEGILGIINGIPFVVGAAHEGIIVPERCQTFGKVGPCGG